MSFRAVDVLEVCEALRCWMGGQDLRKAVAAGADRSPEPPTLPARRDRVGWA